MKKYTSGSFTATKYAIYKEDTDTITTFPSEIIADGENASALIKGNLQQSGTPTPSTPIYPTECGDLVASGEHAGQYDIPILSGSTTTNVYLGEVQSTRLINKVVLTGEETITMPQMSSFQIFGVIGWGSSSVVCSHYPDIGWDIIYPVTQNGCAVRTPDNDRFRISDVSYTTVEDFKTYLAQQYANGTPVTIWYVLATSTTGIVNEPLRKIGDYADSVSTTVPTLATAESITVDTTLKPSALQLTYTGWHTHSDKKRSGGAWT